MNGIVVSFSHTNYCLKSAGTEKYIRSLSKTLQENELSHLHFFSFYHDYSLRPNTPLKMVGVNYNDKFVGIYKYTDILDIICHIKKKYNLPLIAIHIHHLLNHDLTVLSDVIHKLRLPVYYIVHDYHCVCNRLKLIDSNNNFCGVLQPNEQKCEFCEYKDSALQHFDAMSTFFYQIDKYLRYMIVPSKYVQRNLINVYKDFESKFFIREHLSVTGEIQYSPSHEKIRLAFVGMQAKEKGYNDWKNIISCILKNQSDKYELYYLGNGKESIEGVRTIYVSTAEQGDDAMINAVRENRIDCAFVWPLWAETYSYVYYELSVNGVYILTNTVSGNICDQVEQNKNGRVFDSIDSCKSFLSQPNYVLSEINDYRVNGKYRPCKSLNNSDLNSLIPDKTENIVTQVEVQRPNKLLFQTLMYSYKYRIILNR